MVTRTVISITASEAAAFAATSTLSSSAAAAAASADSINNAPAEQNDAEELQTNLKLCNHPSGTKRAQHPSPGGLVQLCRHNGCLNAVDFERRGGQDCIHQKGPMGGEQNDSEDDGKIRAVTGDDKLSDRHSTHENNYGLDEVGKKRALTSGDSISGKDDIKRERVDAFVIDLTDVPPQYPMPKSAGRIKEGSSKYIGVSFDKKAKNKWRAQISIDGRLRYIGHYDNEEEAAVDYARAVFKYKGAVYANCQSNSKEKKNQPRDLDEVGKKRVRPSEESISGKDDNKRQRVDAFVIDLSDVPPQLPISKSAGHIKEGASKYKGVHFDKRTEKWQAQISIDGKQRHIGSYESEEEAAVDYARAVFKYKNQAALGKAREQDPFIIDLTGVPPQSPIPKSAGRIKEGASKYTGVSFNKKMNKWQTEIMIEGKSLFIGCYESEEDAAADYARAVFKYKGQGALDKAREQSSFIIDLTGVPPQPPIPKSEGCIRDGASKYKGVSFNKLMNKWKAQLSIEGKNRCIGHYENEEEAAVDYARAVFKYKNQAALGKAREQDPFIIDLTDVPPQPPIPKSGGYIKEGASKYTGVSFNKPMKKWVARINIEGKNRLIGNYENEKKAAVDYARAVFKYKGQGALDKAREQIARDIFKRAKIDHH
eukprot:scaffold10143_cov119-Skeletonema_dohrnii-CCMP3373.AAC.1